MSRPCPLPTKIYVMLFRRPQSSSVDDWGCFVTKAVETELQLADKIRQNLRLPGRKISLDDVLPGFSYQGKVKGKVVQGSQLRPQQFIDPEKVVEVGPGVLLAGGRSLRVRIDSREVIPPARVLNVDDALTGVDHAVAGVPTGQNTVKHIDPPTDAFNDVGWCSYSHQVAGFAFGEYVATELADAVHVFGWLSHGEAADSIARLVLTGNEFGRLGPQVIKAAALNDREKCLRMPILRCRIGHEFHAALQPPVGEVHAVFSILAGAGVGGAFIECHHDVCSDATLNPEAALRTEQVFTAINVAGKGGAFFRDLAAMRKAEYLIAATVRQDGPLPVHEPVETTGGFHRLHPRPQVEMVGIAQDDLGFYLLLQLGLVDALYRPDRPDRHENGGRYFPVISNNSACAGICLGVGVVKSKLHWREDI